MAEMRSATCGLAKGASCASSSSVARGVTAASRAARASAISRAFAVTQTPEALMHERPPFSTIEDAIRSRWRSQSALASGPSTALL